MMMMMMMIIIIIIIITIIIVICQSENWIQYSNKLAQVSANFGPVLYQIVSNRQYMYLPLM